MQDHTDDQLLTNRRILLIKAQLQPQPLVQQGLLHRESNLYPLVLTNCLASNNEEQGHLNQAKCIDMPRKIHLLVLGHSRISYVALVLSAMLLSGCSYLIMYQSDNRLNQKLDAAVSVLKTGNSRSEVVERIGKPDETAILNGKRVDTYYAGASVSTMPADKYIEGDFQTGFLLETIFTPASLVSALLQRGNQRLTATYGTDDRIETVDRCYLPCSEGEHQS